MNYFQIFLESKFFLQEKKRKKIFLFFFMLKITL